MTKVSLIIPVYNSEKYLERLFASIVEQNYDNYEIILINDGSTDDSLKIIEDYQKKYSNIVCHTIKNSGPGVARKIGYKKSAGDLLFFIDSDDYLNDNNVISYIVEVYKENKFDLLLYNSKLVFDDKTIISSAFKNKINEVKLGMNNIEKLKNISIDGALWYKVLVRKNIKDEYFIAENSYEDFYTTYTYLNECNNFYVSDKILYCSDRSNIGSISKKVNPEKICKTVDLLIRLYKKTKFKESLEFIIYDFYNFSRRRIEKSDLLKQDKNLYINKIKELKKYFSFKTLINTRVSLTEYLKYFYYLFR